MEIPEGINSNEKKAWFISGYLYNFSIKSKKERGYYVSGSNEACKLMQLRADSNSFFKFANESALEFNETQNSEIKGLFSEMGNYWLKREDLISDGEAKFYFNWGASV